MVFPGYRSTAVISGLYFKGVRLYFKAILNIHIVIVLIITGRVQCNVKV